MTRAFSRQKSQSTGRGDPYPRHRRPHPNEVAQLNVHTCLILFYRRSLSGRGPTHLESYNHSINGV